MRLVNFGQRHSDTDSKISVSTPYDVIIKINSLAALSTSGWEIVLGQNINDVTSDIPTSEDISGVVVGVLGSYNRGKSFLLNQLCDIHLPHGNLLHTEGISITAGRKQASNLIFLDTAGSDTAIPKNTLDDKKATEALLKEIVLHLSSYIIIVVNRLRATDQSYIQQVLKRCEDSVVNKNIIVVHNLMDVETLHDVDQVIEDEVITIFEAKSDKSDTMALQSNQNITASIFFTSTNSGMKVHHFVFAKAGSDAAEIWNEQSVFGIMTKLQTATTYIRKRDIVDEIINFVNKKLPQLFIIDNKQDNASIEGNQQRIHVQMHSTKPHIVLSCRKEMKDLNQAPYKLTLLPKPIFDDTGYFLGISSMDNGQWKPRYNLYETVNNMHFTIELAGARKDDITDQVFEEVIIVRGQRNDLKKTLTSPLTRYKKIPMGEFKLEIPLGCQVDHDKAERKYHEGLYTITCPKKKTVNPNLIEKKKVER